MLPLTPSPGRMERPHRTGEQLVGWAKAPGLGTPGSTDGREHPCGVPHVPERALSMQALPPIQERKKEKVGKAAQAGGLWGGGRRGEPPVCLQGGESTVGPVSGHVI